MDEQQPTTISRQGPPPSPHAERLEFVRAFIDHARHQPSPDRLVARPHTAIFVASGCAIMAVLVGLVFSLFTGDRYGSDPAAAASPSPTGPPTFTAVTGWDCRGEPEHVFEARGRTPQWQIVAGNAWARDGCRGNYATVPLTGDNGYDDPSVVLIWAFTPGFGVDKCDVAAYAPKLDVKQVTPAVKAHFTITAGRDGENLGTFDLNQGSRQGEWLEAGSFPVANGKFTIRLGNRGKSENSRERLIVSQLRITCGKADR
ncbi:hypothetical protein [Catenuloplanes atrovinosus]|uniref:Uncharacterized protein n=1 Tax=Catenuloplanes atrovinosus TaxID=137266 RepID=A0AAE3YLU2_9ACTN|nr:hypothetical protein [Catenuloplanes atrovinosus]MDR7274221.1 hypothetical protein [Catenuloplanes atrovinosus]